MSTQVPENVDIPVRRRLKRVLRRIGVNAGNVALFVPRLILVKDPAWKDLPPEEQRRRQRRVDDLDDALGAIDPSYGGTS